MPSRPAKKSSFIGAATFPARSAVAQLLVACILIQLITPAAMAFQSGPRRASASQGQTANGLGEKLNALAAGVGNLAASFVGLVRAGSPAQDSWNVVLTAVSTPYHDHAGLDYHQPSRKLILSANSPSGTPNSFELVGTDGGHAAFSNVAGLGGEVIIAAARDAGHGVSPAGFQPGELFTSTGVPGAVARLGADGSAVQNPWVRLPEEAGLVGGLHVDTTGVFGGDLLVVTTGGGVWRVAASGAPTRIASLGTRLAGVTSLPDDAVRYGPWAGRLLVGAKDQGTVYAVDAAGQSESFAVGVNPQDIDVVPAHENFYATDLAGGKLWAAPDEAFAGVVGDVLVTQESPGVVTRVRWDGSAFVVTQLAEAGAFKQVTFAPAGVAQVSPVRQVYEKIAVVRHAPQLNSGRVEGTLWQLLAESVELNGNDTITSDLLVPGTPNVTASNAANYGGTIEGTEAAQPTNHTVSISGNAALRHVVTRTNPITLEPVAAPPAPAGARDVSLSKAGETFGDPATLRNLSLSGKAGVVAVPPGTYGRFSAGSHTAFVFGVAGSAQPTVYNLEELSLGGGSELRLNGPVILTVKNSVTLSGSTVGASSDPRLLTLHVSGASTANAESGVKLSGNSVLYGVVRAPQRDITITGNGRLRGTVACDYLFVNGNGVLQITESDIPPPPVNRPPSADAGPGHTITLPTNSVALGGSASDDGLPAGSTLSINWTKVSGPGTVTFADPSSPTSSATFSEEGEYVLKLTASDGLLSSSDTTTVNVIPRNQPPTVDAGPDQTIELPEQAVLRGKVTDDALPRGSTVTTQWSVLSGPGPVTFADPTSAATSAAFTAPGTYTLRLTASDTEFTVHDDLVVTVLKNEPPTVEAGPDRELTLPETASLEAVATDDGLPRGSTLELFWGQVSGPAPVVFYDAFAARTTAAFSAPGTYVLRVTASDGQLSATDQLTVVVRPKPFNARTYTFDADFDEGDLLNVAHSPSNQLQLDSTTRSLNFIWVAVSTKGTVVKINTETGAIIGEYFTSPNGQPRDPSRTTVDQNGNVWATNRAGNSVVHIGLVENGQCVDRNNNGTIETSTGFNNILAWTNAGGANTNGGVTTATDECIIHYTKVNAFGTRHVSVTKDNDIWVSGTGVNAGRFDLIDGKTGVIKRSEPAVGYGGYGGLIDKAGVIWSANPMLRWDTSKPLTGPNTLNGIAFSLQGGRATWDRAGKSSNVPPTFEDVWVEDTTPQGASLGGDGEGWNWTSANPTPYSGTRAHQSNLNGGTHQHYFYDATETLSLNPGDKLFTYVYLDPVNPPSEVMLQWNNGNWEHRAYWGQNIIGWGVNGTESRRFMGPLPPTGQWVKLEVPASQVGLENSGRNWRGYSHPSYGLCIDSQGNVYNTSYGNGTIRKFAPDGTLVASYSQGFSYAQGCVVDRNDDVWVAHSLNGGTVGHLKSNGTYIGNVTVGSGPTGVAVDGAGKVWATNYYSGTVSRINPALGPIGGDGATRVGAVDYTTPFLGGNPYNYSDMTGSTLTAAPASGTWSVVYDSQIAGAEWGRIGWAAQSCGDGSVTVSVASSNNGTTFGPPETVANGADPSVANGRYLKVSVNFKRASSGESPVLYDLSVGTRGYELPVPANTGPSAFAGADQTTTLPDAARLSGTACDDGFPRGAAFSLAWSKVSGPGDVAFTRPNAAVTDATFTVAGTYVLRLTASDSEQTVSDDVTVTALPANMAPVVNAGADKSITLPDTVVMTGTAGDDGLPAGGSVTTFWSQLGGPGGVIFDDATDPSTRAIFPTAGTYALRLTANDSHRVSTDDVVVTVIASPALNGATLALAAGNVGPYVTGTSQPVRATLKNSAGNPLANYGVEFTVTGPNATTGSAVTDASGVATFSYSGTNPGTDSVRALVRNTSTTDINSGAVSMVWTLTAASPPAVQGWIGGPLNGSNATGLVPVTVGAGQTLTGAKVEYWPASDPSAVTVLAQNAQGGPGSTLAALDTTLLANGNYVIRLTAVNAAGEELVSQVIITVAGENKPGRLHFTVNDLTVPVTGLPINIGRTYDSLERGRVGDFGHGWSLSLGKPRLEVSPNNDVTLTEPGGKRVTFKFAPRSFGFPFSFFYQPAYVGEPGVYGSLTSDGCGMLIKSGAQVNCFLATEPGYHPTAYTYTDPRGRVFTMTAGGELRTIKDLNGNVLTFGPDGITSSAGGLNVPFVRDGQGRITQITAPDGRAFRYNYDAAGDLTTVELPGADAPVSYTYDSGHFFLSAIDARGNTEGATTYHPDGRLASLTDAAGNKTSYDYDLVQNKTVITYPDGGVASFSYDAAGMLLSRTDPLGHTTNYTYDGNRNKLTETNALGQTVTHTYDAGGNVASVTDPAGKITRWTYNRYGMPVTATDQLNQVQTTQFDSASNPVSIGDSLGTRASFTWDSRGNPLTVTDGNGKVTRFAYDAYGNTLSKVDPLGRTTSFTYDEMGRVLTMTDARGTTRSAYDELGRLITLTDPLNQVTRYEYDDNGNKTAQVDAADRRTTYEYDAVNRLSKVTNPDASVLTYTYDFRGQPLTETDAEEHTTAYVYDKAGRRVKVVNPDQTEITYAYDEVDRLVSKTDERGNVTRYEYDDSCGCKERLTKVIDPLGGATSYGFDAAGRRASRTDARQQVTRYDYDARNRLVQTTFPDGRTVKGTFDAAGRPVTDTDQAGRVMTYAHDEVGNLTSVTDAAGQTTVNSYDARDNLLSTTDALGRTTRYEYDGLNRLIKRVLPLGMSELYTYDQVGNRVSRTDFRGKQTNYDYDPMNRLSAKRPDASLGEPNVSYTYRPAGQRASMTDASGTTTYTYDARHRLLSKQTPQGTLAYTYDAAGNPATTRSSNAGGVSVDYGFDELNRVKTVKDNRQAAGTTTYSYDAAGNVLGVAAPNGVQSAYTYDTLNRVTLLTHGRAGSTLASYAQTLDPTGRRLSVNEQDGRAVSYAYDSLYRLTNEAVTGGAAPSGNGSVAYTYDAVGNRLSRISTLAAVLSSTSVYDANDRLTSDSYDANGNTRAAAGSTYAYDFEDRIRTVNGGAARLVYDGDGNRVAKTVGGVTTRYLVDDLTPTGYSQVAEELAGGVVQRTYTYGKRLLSQTRQTDGGPQVSYYGLDAHGNVRFLTDGAGAVTDTYAYDSFGVLTTATGTTPNNYLFYAQQYDHDLGLYFKRARYYSQDRGRFMTMDPMPGKVTEPLSLHRYMFGHADPVNRTDPCGTVAMAEYATITVNISLRQVAALAAIGYAVACLFYISVSALDPGFTPPLAFRGCKRNRCNEYFQECLENPWQPEWNRENFGPRKDCLSCKWECEGNNGVWPAYKCPVT
jgi:RHS repeat-associated protein